MIDGFALIQRLDDVGYCDGCHSNLDVMVWWVSGFTVVVEE
jgi:hypothetical protein